MITQRIDDLTYADIERLVEQGIPESRVLDYKRQLPGRTLEDVTELLADVTSFANASGGHLVFGVTTAKVNGKNSPMPDSINGVGNINTEEVENCIDAQLRSCIQPRITGLRVRAIVEEGNPTVVVIHIPRSWNAPHMIAKGSSKFYSRTSAGKQPLDVTEIRHAFAMSESVGERIRAFREERVNISQTRDRGSAIPAGPALIVHVIPIQSFAERITLDIPSIRMAVGDHLLLDKGDGSGDITINFDGIRVSAVTKFKESGHALVFRTGAVELIDTNILRPYEEHKFMFKPEVLEKGVIQAVTNVRSMLKGWDLASPLAVFVTLLKVKGYQMLLPNLNSSVGKVDRDKLLMPEVIEEDAERPIEVSLRYAFDMIWQSCGEKRCLNYSPDGKWKAYP